MPTKGSCLQLITSGSTMWRVKRMTSITPSKDQFLLSLCYTSAGLHHIRSFNISRACPAENQYRPVLWGASSFTSGCHVLKLNKMWWWLLQRTKIHIVGLIMLTGSSGLSNRLIQCILSLVEQLLDRHILSEIMLHKVESRMSGLYIIMWIWIPTWLYIKLQCLNQGV